MMTSKGHATSEADVYLSHLKKSRNSRSVLKLRLINLRSSLPDVAICVFEGDDDKIVYSRWFRRLAPTTVYEPFVCDGKRAMRQLNAALHDDKSGLHHGVFFFVDRDFDDLDGFVSTHNIFVTDRYSVENYLVSSEVLDSCLRDEFPLDGDPATRTEILSLFDRALAQFLEVYRPFNLRLFIARRLGIGLEAKLPSRISALAGVSLIEVVPPSVPPEKAVCYSQAPSAEVSAALETEFGALDPYTRYRGKGLLLFFVSWLEKLCSEYDEPQIGIFGDGKDRASKVRRQEFCLGGFAAKSGIPEGLSQFFQKLAA